MEKTLISFVIMFIIYYVYLINNKIVKPTIKDILNGNISQYVLINLFIQIILIIGIIYSTLYVYFIILFIFSGLIIKIETNKLKFNYFEEYFKIFVSSLYIIHYMVFNI